MIVMSRTADASARRDNDLSGETVSTIR